MSPPPKHENVSDSLVSLEGIIIPVKWDADGEVAAIAIATTDERQLLVDENTATGKELRRFLRTAVKLKGWLHKAAEHEHIIEVQEYHLVKSKKSRRQKDC